MQSPDWTAHFFPPTHLNNRLPGIFDRQRVTNSYKFFWFLALLDFVERADQYDVAVDDLIVEMVVQVWYPVNLFRLNLGKADQLGDAVERVRDATELTGQAKEEAVRAAVRSVREVKGIKQRLRDLRKFVPYRLLSVWFPQELRGLKGKKHRDKTVELAAAASKNRTEAPLYHFSGTSDERIHLNYHWFWYLRDHAAILREYTLHHLLDYLQRRNPNTPNLRQKLRPRTERRLAAPRKLWKAFLHRHPGTRDIFSREPIGQLSLDHFLPWTFVAHDQLWNLSPVSQRTNSQKGNRLPGRAHLPDFTALQYAFWQDLYAHQPRSQGLEDYASFFNRDPEEMAAWPEPFFQARMEELVTPQLVVARNMGFVPF